MGNSAGARRRRSDCGLLSFVLARVIFITLQHAKTEPAPIDAMALNQALVIQLHRLDEIHLFAFSGVTRIFPDQPLAVGQVAGSEILAHRRFPDREHVEQWTKLLSAVQIPALTTEQ